MTTEQSVDDKKQPGLLRSSFLVGAVTLFSRLLGLVRDVVIANSFGSGTSADAFFVAFKIPNFLRRLFAEGAFSQAFVPVLSEYRSRCTKDEVRQLIQTVSGTLAGYLLIVTLLAMVSAPLLIRLFAPGFSQNPEKLALAEEMLRITFPYLFFISMTALAGGILNSYNRFAVPAIAPVLLNLSLIGATLLFAPSFDEPVKALAWGVVVAGASQLLLQMPFLAKLDLLVWPVWNTRHDGVKRIMKLMAPALFGVSVSQINLLLDTVLASFLQTGSVSWLYYSDRLLEMPLGVFGVAIATVILPSLSRKHANASPEQFSNTLDWAVRLVLLIGVPAALSLIVLAEPLMATLFHYGAMSDRDVIMAGMSLRAYAFGLVAFMLVKVLAPGYFARQDTKTPVKVAIVAMVANMVFNLALVFWLQHTGLALATTLSAVVNATLLGAGLMRSGVFRPEPGWWLFAGQLLLSTLLLVACLLWLRGDLLWWLQVSPVERAIKMLMLVVGGTLLYVSVLLLSGVRPKHFLHEA